MLKTGTFSNNVPGGGHKTYLSKDTVSEPQSSAVSEGYDPNDEESSLSKEHFITLVGIGGHTSWHGLFPLFGTSFFTQPPPHQRQGHKSKVSGGFHNNISFYTQISIPFDLKGPFSLRTTCEQLCDNGNH